jgi:hypothetical protein
MLYGALGSLHPVPCGRSGRWTGRNQGCSYALKRDVAVLRDLWRGCLHCRAERSVRDGFAARGGSIAFASGTRSPAADRVREMDFVYETVTHLLKQFVDSLSCAVKLRDIPPRLRLAEIVRRSARAASNPNLDVIRLRLLRQLVPRLRATGRQSPLPERPSEIRFPPVDFLSGIPVS